MALKHMHMLKVHFCITIQPISEYVQMHSTFTNCHGLLWTQC